MTERNKGKYKTTGLIPVYGVKMVDGKKVRYIKNWSDRDLSIKKKRKKKSRAKRQKTKRKNRTFRKK